MTGIKHDAGKAGFDLIPWEPLAAVQRVLVFGGEKYEFNNWRKGMRWLRLFNACFRHLFAWVAGEKSDPETGESHLAHALCCLLFLLHYEMTGTGTDDRKRYVDVEPEPVSIKAPAVVYEPYSEALDAA